MTGEFSRRSFLKYTALTAVAVAGSSLLTGCSGYAPVQHARRHQQHGAEGRLHAGAGWNTMTRPTPPCSGWW